MEIQEFKEKKYKATHIYEQQKNFILGVILYKFWRAMGELGSNVMEVKT